MVQPLTLRELSDLLPRLHATVDTLVGAATNNKQRGKRRRASAPRMARKPRVGGAELQRQLLGALKRYPKKGAALGELVKGIGADRSSVQYHLRALRAGKQARVVGERGDARWFAA